MHFNSLRTTVINIHHRHEYDVYIGRPGRGAPDTGWQNKFRITETASRQDVVRMHEDYLLGSDEPDAKWMRANLHTLKGQRLGCFCHPADCHGHTYAKYANALKPGQVLPKGGLPGIPRFAPDPRAPQLELFADITRGKARP